MPGWHFALADLLTHTITNPQSNPHNFSSCTTSAYLGIPRDVVSYCDVYSCPIHTVEVTGSNPVAPTIPHQNLKP